jgi:hypothetical protein
MCVQLSIELGELVQRNFLMFAVGGMLWTAIPSCVMSVISYQDLQGVLGCLLNICVRHG